MDRGQAGILDRAGDQPGEDAGDQAEAEGNESGLSGFHVSVRSFAPRVGAASLPECDSLHQGPGSGAGEAAGVDYRAAEWRPDPPTDWGLEPSPEKLGDLFPLWLSEASFRSDQRLRAVAPLETPAASQPAALPAPERHDGLCPDEASGLDRPVIGADGGGLCMFAASVSARAGCGKPARPVRRGERQSCLGIGTSPTLPPPEGWFWLRERSQPLGTKPECVMESIVSRSARLSRIGCVGEYLMVLPCWFRRRSRWLGPEREGRKGPPLRRCG